MNKLFVLLIVCVLTGSVTFGQGTLRGKVTDTNGETLIGALITLKSNRTIGAVTDFDGNYTLKISDTTSQIVVVSYISYTSVEESVHLVNGKVIIRNFILTPASNMIGEVVITARATKANDSYMAKMKVNSAATLDYISAETMKQTGDVNVVSAVARVSGVSTNGGFITVRGIGDRYVKTTINGSRIPTLDPFTNNIKLDMFPSSLVDNILITKTASPDLPGDWAGAYLSVETKDYPEQLAVYVDASVGYNNQSSFKDMITSDRSSTDWLGYDNGLREQNHDAFVSARPTIDPSPYQEMVALGLADYFKELGVTQTWSVDAKGDVYHKLGLVKMGLLAEADFDDAEAFKYAKEKYNEGPYKAQAFNLLNAKAAKSGQSFSNNWNTFTRKAPLSFSQSFSVGNQTTLLGKPLGFMFGYRYGSSVLYDPNSTANRTNQPESVNGVILPISSLNQKFSRETNGWSALMNLACKINSNNSVSLLFMPNFTGVNNVRDAIDTITAPSPYFYAFTKNQFYEERNQMVYQFKSEHYLPVSKLKIELNASYSDGKSSVPDFKNLEYFADEHKNYRFDKTLSDVRRNYRYLSEDLFDSRLSAELPLGDKPGLSRKIKVGGAYQSNTKKFDQYDYLVTFNSGADVIIKDNNIEQFFNLDKFGIITSNFNSPHQSIDLYYEESGNPANHTIGYSNVTAGFLMLDYTIIPSLRFSGGLRVEQANLFTDVFKYDSLGLGTNDGRREYAGQAFIPNPGKMNELSYLPSANIIYKLKNDEQAPVNLRLNYSQTLARPSIREFSETIVRDYELNADVFGNTELKMIQIDNYDLRLESYFKSGDNISVSLFYKDLKNHIELINSNIGFSWTNVDQSKVMGIELEGRKALTKYLELRANVTFVNSKTTVVEKQLMIADNRTKVYVPIDTVTRGMFGQAPYVINGILAYNADSLGLSVALSYNVQGAKLVLTSSDGAPDIFEVPRHLLDLKVTKSLGKHFSTSFTVRDILNSPIRRSYDFAEGYVLDFDKYTYGTNYILGISYKL